MAKGFVKGVKSELKKVVWPTKEQLKKNTVFVLVIIIAFSIIVLGFDVILKFVDSNLWNFIANKLGQ